VIFAGYTEKMKIFLEQNEGLRSRIAFHLNFPDYTATELLEILKLMAEQREYCIEEDAFATCKSILDKACAQENFGNGRYVRNFLEQAILRQSARIIKEASVQKERGMELGKEEFRLLTKDDFRPILQGENKRESKLGFAC